MSYSLSLHDALPISTTSRASGEGECSRSSSPRSRSARRWGDRKSTRLNSRHTVISYAVFCSKKKIYANHFYRSAHKFKQICRHRLRRQNVGYSNFSQPQSFLSFCVLLPCLTLFPYTTLFRSRLLPARAARASVRDLLRRDPDRLGAG